MGGTEPVWARSGRELFYRNGDKMMVVAVETGSTLKAGPPRELFEGQYSRVVWGEANYSGPIARPPALSGWVFGPDRFHGL